MLNQPKPKPQPTPGSFTKALDQIFEGRVPKDHLVPHEERPKTYDAAKKSLFDICETIRDQARNAGFQWLLKPQWLIDRENKK